MSLTYRNSLALALVALLSIGTVQAQQGAYSRARIHYANAQEFEQLAVLGVALDHGLHKRNVYIESEFSQHDISIAQSMGLYVEILIEDAKQDYLDRNKRGESAIQQHKNANCAFGGTTQYTMPTNFNHGSMGGFLTYSEALDELDDMVAQYPSLITARQPISTFTTLEGRPIEWLKISDNPGTDEAEPEMLYNAVHHAREPGSLMQLIHYMWYLLENYATDPEVQAIVNNTELYFVPIVNPDGYVYNETTDPNGGGFWRKNRRVHGNGDFGVDLNRNYDFFDAGGTSVWGTTGISFTTSSDVYCGTAPFSEVETQAMKWFINQREFKQAFNNHTYSELLLYPFGYLSNTPTVDDAIFRAHSALLVSQSGYTAEISSELYPASGVSDDWMYGETSQHDKIFSYTPEIGYAFWPLEADIDAICHEMMYTNLTAAHLITNYALAHDTDPVGIELISGYLHYDLQRLGFDASGTFTVDIDPISSNIISVGSANTHTAMTLLQEDQDSISYNLDPSVTTGDIVKYALTVDNGLYVFRDTIERIFGTGQVIFSDPADVISGWTPSGTWGISSTTFYSSPSSITDSPNSNYANNSSSMITLNATVDLFGAYAATLTYQAKWSIENNYDYVQVLVSSDNGFSWTPQCGQYTNTGGIDQGAANGKPVYDGVQIDWVQENIDLSDYLGQQIRIRFILETDGAATAEGFYFDDLEVFVVQDGTVGIDDVQSPSLTTIVPNPATEVAVVSYVLPNSSGHAFLRLVNMRGQEVRRMAIDPKLGSTTFSLAGMPSGVYMVTIETNGTNSLPQRLVVVK